MKAGLNFNSAFNVLNSPAAEFIDIEGVMTATDIDNAGCVVYGLPLTVTGSILALVGGERLRLLVKQIGFLA